MKGFFVNRPETILSKKKEIFRILQEITLDATALAILYCFFLFIFMKHNKKYAILDKYIYLRRKRISRFCIKYLEYTHLTSCLSPRGIRRNNWSPLTMHCCRYMHTSFAPSTFINYYIHACTPFLSAFYACTCASSEHYQTGR